ncbi:ABC transporter ATP-binding protein [Fodinibius sp.]|uniref:ABC transporter ATP-binding protein n=1 Tax=Fodinibius sp. TaxID=1872440 RepID=UPI002ACE5612|nr:ATP-binding cassette domain-containing protein [Fodinibius sp.]MDZ7659048.1 ATP-binding cassette domain-containing protein [Fodinibius sp.]
MARSPNISFNSVTFGFENEQIVTDFSFVARPGQHTLLKGESGSGKSTLLKLLLGFHKPRDGTISINRENYDAQKIRKQTAWLPQDLNLGSGTVAEVMDKPFEFSANQSTKNTQQNRIKTLKALGLAPDILGKQFRDLSTGQRQRVGLAICHLLDKPLLLLDEPTSALDKASKQKAAELLLKSDRTIISTSHDPFWVAKAENIIELS